MGCRGVPWGVVGCHGVISSTGYTPSGAILVDRLAMGGIFAIGGREARREGWEVGDEGAGGGDRGDGKRGSSTPCPPHTVEYKPIFVVSCLSEMC